MAAAVSSEHFNILQLLLKLVHSLHVLSHHVVFYNLSSPEQILDLFPESFHSSLKNLITKILLENRLGQSDVVPTCLVQLNGEKQTGSNRGLTFQQRLVNRMLFCFQMDDPAVGPADSVSVRVTVELSRESLDTICRTGTHQRPAVCGRWEMRDSLIG
ncbi:COMM domain-containing protein 9 [Nibea albiflora]|uniref:COMM domain-containing protein 9 n=1 Tax=Nibea albiflora TaxID=240163 RepID=A0ACB7FFQ1_NIBAL|nr:COMM domain-containing protein 9 [Nibea albiflora]